MSNDYWKRKAEKSLAEAAEALDCKPCPRDLTDWVDRAAWYHAQIDKRLRSMKDARGDVADVAEVKAEC